jgi:uncharacterized membrane protein YdjX (TVP38/TMEM64 family)
VSQYWRGLRILSISSLAQRQDVNLNQNILQYFTVSFLVAGLRRRASCAFMILIIALYGRLTGTVISAGALFIVSCCFFVQYYRKARSLALSRTHPELFRDEFGVSFESFLNM